MANLKNRRNIQSIKGDGHFGDTFDAGIKNIFGMGNLVSRGRSWDLVLNGKRYELKTGAGELGNANMKAIYGSSKVIYCPVYDEKLSVEEQEAFVIDKKAFLQVIKDAGLYRESKTTTNNRQVHAIQTFWNRTKKAPHSKKAYERLLDGLYDNMNMMLDEFIEVNK
ncbi:MAG TPA: hypothetical protein VFD25_05325 [Clostridia bacterium]|nr:hypothetical protein [Clostridia bacterium]